MAAVALVLSTFLLLCNSLHIQSGSGVIAMNSSSTITRGGHLQRQSSPGKRGSQTRRSFLQRTGKGGGGGSVDTGEEDEAEENSAEGDVPLYEEPNKERKNNTGNESFPEAQINNAKEQGDLASRIWKQKVDTIQHEVNHRPHLSLLIFASLVALIVTIFKLAHMYQEYRASVDLFEVDGDTSRVGNWNFRKFVFYRFGYWFSWTPGASGTVLTCMSSMILLFFAVTYCMTHLKARAHEAFLKIFVWLVDPDGGTGEDTFSGHIIGACVSVVGLVLFAMLLATVQESFNNYLDSLRMGYNAVLESKHIVIIGFAPETLVLIQGLCKAYEATGGTTICILATQPKIDVEESIRSFNVKNRGSRVVVRSGVLHDKKSLRSVSVQTCSKVVVVPDVSGEREVRDADALQVLIQLRGSGWPINGRIIVACALIRNKPLFQQMGGKKTHVLMLDKFVAKLMVQCSRGSGLGMAVIEMLGFKGHDFYIKPVPKQLAGKTLLEAAAYFPSAVLCGVASSDTAEIEELECLGLCPEDSTTLKLGEDLVFLANGVTATIHGKNPFAQIPSDDELKLKIHTGLVTGPSGWSVAASASKGSTTPTPLVRRDRGRQHSVSVSFKNEKDHVFIIGFNEVLGMMLLELDEILFRGSTVTVLSPTKRHEREEFVRMTLHRWGKELHNIEVIHVEGRIGSRFVLEKLGEPVVADDGSELAVGPSIEKATRIFVLFDREVTSSSHADASVITAVLHIRDVIKSRLHEEPQMPIVPELMESRSTDLCHHAGIFDHVNAVTLQAEVVASVVIDTRLEGLLERLVSENDYIEVCLRKLSAYFAEVPEEVSFLDCTVAARKAHEVALGWTRCVVEEEEGLYSTRETRVELNPPNKEVKRAWDPLKDKLMVLRRVTEETHFQFESQDYGMAMTSKKTGQRKPSKEV